MTKITKPRKRDDFLNKVVRSVADRAGNQCSNPGCQIYTIGPALNDPQGVIRTSVAAHITAATEGGPRFNPKLSKEQRRSIDNAIHLCGTCARLIDANGGKDHPPEMLFKWKKDHETSRADRLANPYRYQEKRVPDFLSLSAQKIMRRTQWFEDDFLFERHRSFGGNFELIIERQKVMGELMNTAILDLKSELIFFPGQENATRRMHMAAITILRLYRLADQTTPDGLPFWGKEAASQSSLEMPASLEEFKNACTELQNLMRLYLK